jgi:prophage regulatory protein
VTICNEQVVCMILQPKQVEAQTGLSNTTIWRLQRAGQFPAYVKLSSRRVGLPASKLADWLAEREAETA